MPSDGVYRFQEREESGEGIVLTSVLKKTTAKVPKADMNEAKRYRQDFLDADDVARADSIQAGLLVPAMSVSE